MLDGIDKLPPCWQESVDLGRYYIERFHCKFPLKINLCNFIDLRSRVWGQTSCFETVLDCNSWVINKFRSGPALWRKYSGGCKFIRGEGKPSYYNGFRVESKDNLEMVTTMLHTSIRDSFTSSCTEKIIQDKSMWWINELNNLRKDTRRKLRVALCQSGPEH